MTEQDHEHAAGCTGCHATTDDTAPCHGCGHWRNDIWDYSHGYYCTDCRLAIQHWREAEASYRAISGFGPADPPPFN